MKNIGLRSLSLLIALLFIALSLASCGKSEEKISVFPIHSELQAKYLEGNHDHFSLYAKGKDEFSRPQSVTISWWKNETEATVYVSEKEDYSSPIVASGIGSAEIFNLKIGTKYYFKVEDSTGVIEEGKFMTEDIAPRNLFVSGVTNVRDIGGWKNGSGKMIKQGMIYRSAKLTADLTGERLITDDGINTMRNTLGIVCEIDLRRTESEEQGNITESALGKDVKYISFPMKSSGNCLTLNKDLLDDFFTILADESNYPMDFHCSIGTDRTGFIAFLMNALLGASEDDLYKDYLFSNFGDIGGMRTNSAVKGYIQTVSSADGKDLAEKTYNYLVSVGVKSEKIDKFIEIMTK